MTRNRISVCQKFIVNKWWIELNFRKLNDCMINQFIGCGRMIDIFIAPSTKKIRYFSFIFLHFRFSLVFRKAKPREVSLPFERSLCSTCYSLHWFDGIFHCTVTAQRIPEGDLGSSRVINHFSAQTSCTPLISYERLTIDSQAPYTLTTTDRDNRKYNHPRTLELKSF